jgi:hypothetical protein
MKYVWILISLLLVCTPALAEEGGPDVEAKTLSGMSVLGNNEAPKALVIVPWKSSQIGDGIGVVESLSNRPMPVDREVFGRELEYYLIRSEGTVPDDMALRSAR